MINNVIGKKKMTMSSENKKGIWYGLGLIKFKI